MNWQKLKSNGIMSMNVNEFIYSYVFNFELTFNFFNLQQSCYTEYSDNFVFFFAKGYK
jgi:hypothetical protein